MTQDKYRRVWTPVGERVLRVEDSEGEGLSVEVLSRGVREQLFLSLRLALARRISPAAGPCCRWSWTTFWSISTRTCPRGRSGASRLCREGPPDARLHLPRPHCQALPRAEGAAVRTAQQCRTQSAAAGIRGGVQREGEETRSPLSADTKAGQVSPDRSGRTAPGSHEPPIEPEPVAAPPWKTPEPVYAEAIGPLGEVWEEE